MDSMDSDTFPKKLGFVARELCLLEGNDDDTDCASARRTDLTRKPTLVIKAQIVMVQAVSPLPNHFITLLGLHLVISVLRRLIPSEIIDCRYLLRRDCGSSWPV